MNRTGCCCEKFSAPDDTGRTVTRETRRDCCPVHTTRGGSDDLRGRRVIGRLLIAK